MINGHGNNLYDYSGSILADFSSNIAFNHKSEELLPFLKEKISCIHNYPDPNAKVLTNKIAKHHRVDKECVLVTNGSAEAFYLIAHLLEGIETTICIPSFSEYEDACRLYKHNLHFLELHRFAEQNFSSSKSVWLGNPNNPDGYITPWELIGEQCKKYRDTFFVVDAAYSELSSVQNRDSKVITQSNNLITVRSLTKAFAIPGLRLGYIVAHSYIISRLSAMRPPWSVNTLSLEVGTYIMDHYSRLLPSLRELSNESLFLQKELSMIKGIEVIPSTCNFFLSKLKKGEASILKEYLMQEYYFLIRDASNFRGLDSSYFRIAAQTNAQNKMLVDAIRVALDHI